MFFKEPRIEFISIEPAEVLRTSGGAAVDVCAPGSANDDIPIYDDEDRKSVV